MKRKIVGTGWVLLILTCFFVVPAVMNAQEGTPRIQELLIELWPEYDRPEVLVIHRARLSPDTPLPAQLTFRLPDYVEAMHAVAVEQDGALVDANPDTVELRQEEDSSLLTLTTPSPNVQLEYYDPVILSKEDQTRQLTYEFTAPHEIETVTFKVQEPFQATAFSMTPEASNSFIGTNGLRYNNIDVAGMDAGEPFSLTATYRRTTDELSVEGLANVPQGLSAGTNQAVDLDNPAGLTLGDESGPAVGYLLVGAGIGLLVATGGYWWWSNRVKKDDVGRQPARHQTGPRPGYRRKQAAGKSSDPREVKEPVPETAVSSAGYCHRCGAALRADANFCHICGTERRSS